MGFWNALSALAPVAPAMSDARDLRTARDQQTQTFAQDQALKQAQLTVSQLAASGEKQRQAQAAQPKFLGDPQWNPLTMSMQGVTLDPTTGTLALKDVPGGVDPVKKAEAIISERETTTGVKLSPEEKQNIYDQVEGIHPLASRVTQLTGDAGKPYKGNDGQYYVDAKDATTGTIVQMPLGPNYNPPAPKPSTSPAAQYANLLSKQILASKKQGPPLTNEEAAQLQASRAALDEAGVARANAMAQAAAANNMMAATDDSGQDVLVTRAQLRDAANAGIPFAAGVVGAPTATDKKNQMLAQSALTQINTMERVLAADPNLVGPGAGQLTKLQTWLGTNSEDSQQFLAAATFLSEHGVGVFGGRNIHSIQDLQNLMGDLKTNPAALKAALEQARTTMQPWATAGGRLSPSRSGGSAPQAYKQTATNPQTKHKIGSNDGVHWFDIQTGQAVK